MFVTVHLGARRAAFASFNNDGTPLTMGESNSHGDQLWLNTTKTAAHFDYSSGTVQRWQREKGFPETAIRAVGAFTEYDVGAIEAWLRSRPPARRRPYKYRGPGASDLRATGQ